jgi:regulatory protein
VTLTPSEAYQAALEFIKKKDRLEQEVRDFLVKSGASGEVIQETIARIKTNGYLNDQRILVEFVERSAIAKGHGVDRIRQELARRGIDGECVEQVIALADIPDQFEAACTALGKNSERQTNPGRAARFLLQRGFESTVVERVIRQQFPDIEA